MQYGIYYLEMHLLMAIPEVRNYEMRQRNDVFNNVVQVYEMLSGRERDEIKLMAVIVAVYYAPYMLKAKDTAR